MSLGLQLPPTSFAPPLGHQVPPAPPPTNQSLCICSSSGIEPSSPQKSIWLIVSFLGAFASLTILFKVCPPHIPYPSSPPYFSPKQSDPILIHYIIHMFIHLLSVSPARMGAPQGQGFLNALIIAMCSTPRTVPGTWQAFKKRVEK